MADSRFIRNPLRFSAGALAAARLGQQLERELALAETPAQADLAERCYDAARIAPTLDEQEQYDAHRQQAYLGLLAFCGAELERLCKLDERPFASVAQLQGAFYQARREHLRRPITKDELHEIEHAAREIWRAIQTTGGFDGLISAKVVIIAAASPRQERVA